MNFDTLIVLMLLAALIVAILNQWRDLGFGYEYAYADGYLLGDSSEKEERPKWHDIAMFKKGGGGSAPAADPNIGKAALKNAQVGEDWLKFAEEQFKVSNERQVGQDKLANEVTQQQLDSSKQAQGWATADRDRYETVFRPMQDQFIDEANSWDSAERQSARAAEAKADVMNNSALARQASERNMASMGVDPTSGRYAGVTRAGDQATALSAAGAENNARSTVRKEGVAMRADAINMGNGLAVNPATSLGLSSSTGSAAYGTTAANNAQAAGLGGIMGQGYQGAMSGNSSMAGILNQQYGNQLNAWQAQNAASSASSSSLWGGIGSLAGMGMMAMSSKEYKEDKQPVDGALDAIKSMPVEKWKYKDGISDGGEHIGAYAEDFQKATGLGDGKTINLVDGMGLTMKAVQELSDKIDNLEGSKGITKNKRTVRAS